MTLQYLPLEALSTLENLQELDASFNNFTNITRNFFKGLSVKTLNLTSCNISEIQHHAFQDFNKTNLILDENHISNLAFLSLLSHSAFGNLTLNENGFNCSALEHKVCSVVFETLEGYCTVGNETRQLSAYFIEELNMKMRSSSGNMRLNRELVVLLTAFISSIIIGICACHWIILHSYMYSSKVKNCANDRMKKMAFHLFLSTAMRNFFCDMCFNQHYDCIFVIIIFHKGSVVR